jgi:hypothetical protein
VDKNLEEFWVSNPWDIVSQGHNLSAFERSRCFLNVRGQDFLDISYLSGADNDGDGRSVAAGDFRNNGRIDVVVRKIGGGRVDRADGWLEAGTLQLYENNFPQRHYLEVTLRGAPTRSASEGTQTRSNRQGIGARLIAVVHGRQQVVRDMYPSNSFQSQMPNIVHLGLGDHDKVERLIIRWPSGTEQVLTDVAGDRHIVVEEGKQGADAIETVEPGRTIRP